MLPPPQFSCKLWRFLKQGLALLTLFLLFLTSCSPSSDTTSIPQPPSPTLSISSAENIETSISVTVDDNSQIAQVKPCQTFSLAHVTVLLEDEPTTAFTTTFNPTTPPSPYFDASTPANNTNAVEVVLAGNNETSYTFTFNVVIQECSLAALSGSGTPTDPWQISDDMHLALVSTLVNQPNSIYADDTYSLISNIDLGITNAPWSSQTAAAGFTPIGTDNSKFSGTFNCNKNIISNLYINHSSPNSGLFGFATGTIMDCGLVSASVTGISNIGGLVGSLEAPGTVERSFSSGNFNYSLRFERGGPGIGGLVGNNSGTIRQSYSRGAVSFYLGTVGGGLVGNNLGTISDSYSTAAVSGRQYVAGLVGEHFMGSIINSYATGPVRGGSTVPDMFSTRGLAVPGRLAGSVTASYFDTETTGQQPSTFTPLGEGRNTATMTNAAAPGTTVYVNWDTDIWSFPGDNYPTLDNVPCPNWQHADPSSTPCENP
ncbi:hypothetical protein COTS27_00528 [Spirochaetota bacterium]|nr:hypothetical protein COTS27_00528 [Spirochaetota bacterium]